MVGGGFHVAWSVTQTYVKDQAVLGMLLTAAVCFIVLILSTCNLAVAFFAMMLVGGILGSVLSVVNLFLEWEIGFIECLALVVIVGFSGRFIIIFSGLCAPYGYALCLS